MSVEQINKIPFPELSPRFPVPAMSVAKKGLSSSYSETVKEEGYQSEEE